MMLILVPLLLQIASFFLRNSESNFQTKGRYKLEARKKLACSFDLIANYILRGANAIHH